MSVESSETSELLYRFNSLANKYVKLSLEISKLFEKFGNYRKELQLIAVELGNRGINANSPEELTRQIEEAISKLGNIDEQQ